MSYSTRKTSVSGLFYASNCKELSTNIAQFNKKFNELNIAQDILNIKPKVIIVPHAGYIYSGFTANMAYRFAANAQVKRIIVIGPSHHHYFSGISGSYFEKYETPCGNLDIDSAYLFAMAKTFNISFEAKAHLKEHSTEVQMPFIKHYFKTTEVIELIYGDIAVNELSNIIYALLSNKENLLVISTDLSHFHTLKNAKQHDNVCLKAIEALNVKIFSKECEACGLLGLKALVMAAQKLKLKSKILDYSTSAKITKDESSVVGYMSAVLY